ncbi:hypothetical protein HDV03_000448 [Kappamyces sp. JEL0829]|nr:hypothetical protein HDV03_000448 [Kappamyces sp. JEL0829]
MTSLEPKPILPLPASPADSTLRSSSSTDCSLPAPRTSNGTSSAAKKAKQTLSKCQHGRNQAFCIPCKGSQICVHRKLRAQCKDCGGSAICLHHKQRAKCKDCKGSQICVHDKQKDYCVTCKGKQICVHLRHRAYCKECMGSMICVHKKERSWCAVCGDGGKRRKKRTADAEPAAEPAQCVEAATPVSWSYGFPSPVSVPSHPSPYEPFRGEADTHLYAAFYSDKSSVASRGSPLSDALRSDSEGTNKCKHNKDTRTCVYCLCIS